MMLLHSLTRRRRSIAAIAVCIALSGLLYVSVHETEQLPVQSAHANVLPDARTIRLTKRLAQRFDLRTEDAFSMLQKKEYLAHAGITMIFQDADHLERIPEPVFLSLAEHQNWIVFDATRKTFVPDTRSIRYFLETSLKGVLPPAHRAVALQSGSGTWTIRGSASAGYTLNFVAIASVLASAIEQGKSSIDITVHYEDATLLLVSDTGVSELQLLSRGMSDFAKSPFGREANIRHALDTYLNGIVVPAGEIFSFNSALRDSEGWSQALIIGEGGKLVLEPGGGICQAASTVYRAALLAGLPITKRANHSLYVGYYEEYGVGLDATIYPGKQDFTFRNDTGAPLIMAARSEGTQAIVEFYGKSDGRTVSLEGPFFSTSNDGFEKKLSIKQIGWNYGITYSDGRTMKRPIVSTYTMLPKAIRTKYAEAQGIRLLSELAPNVVEGRLTMR